MRFAVWGVRHYHIADAVRELISLGHRCAGVLENESPLGDRLRSEFNLPAIEDAKAFWKARPEMVLAAPVNNRKIDIIELCAARAIPIMLDKPLVTGIADLNRLERAMEAEGSCVGMMLTERFNPPILALKRALDDGEIGSLVSLSFLKPHKLNPASREAWHFDRAQNGGVLIDLMVHDFDLLRFLSSSEFRGVRANLRIGGFREYPDMPDDARALVTMANGVTASLQVDWWMPAASPVYGNGRIIATGTKGRCEVFTTGDPVLHPAPFALIATDKEPGRILENPVPGFLMADFLARVQGKPAIISANDILQAVRASVLADANAETIVIKGV